jgi:hypothetical protein
VFKEFINDFGKELLALIITSVATYIGVQLKRIYEDKVNTATKKKLAKTAVEAVEQMYTDLHGNEKYFKAEEALVAMLQQKGIQITEIECEMFIEAAVLGLKNGWQKEGTNNEI